jgi:hypothetical protein
VVTRAESLSRIQALLKRSEQVRGSGGGGGAGGVAAPAVEGSSNGYRR